MKNFLVCFLMFIVQSAICQEEESVQMNLSNIYSLDKDIFNGFDNIQPVYHWKYSMVRSNGYLIDVQGNMVFDSIRSPSWQIHFTDPNHWNSDPTVLELVRDPVIWSHYRLRGSSLKDSEYLFQVGEDQRSFDMIDIYAVGQEGQITHRRSGSKISPGEKDIRDVYNFFRVSIKQGEEIDLYLRMSGYSGNASPPELAIGHIDPESMRELEACRLQTTFLVNNASEQFRNYTKFSHSIEHVTDAGYTIEMISDPVFWDQHARFNSGMYYPMRDTFWIRARLVNLAKHHVEYFFYLQKWTWAEIYLPDREGVYQSMNSGTSVPLKEKNYRDPLNFFQILMSAGDTVDIYIKAFTSLPSLTHPIHQEFVLAQVDEKVYQDEKQENNLLLLFHGYLLAAYIMCFVVFLMLPRQIIFFFSLCVLGNIIYVTTDYPMETVFDLFPQLVNFQVFSRLVASPLIMIGGVKFLSIFIELEKWMPGSRKVINLVLGTYLVTVVYFIFSIGFHYEIIRRPSFHWFLSQPVAPIFFYGTCILGATGFLLIFLIPWFGIWKKVHYSWVLMLSTMAPALSTTTWYLSPVFTKTNALYSTLVLGEPINQLYIPTQIGVFLFVTVFAILIGLQVRDFNRERQKSLQTQLASEQRVARELRKVDALKDQFLANTSHELRTPLQGIIGLTESLQDQETEKPRRENLSMIISSARRLNNLVDDILDFSKLKNYDITLARKPVNLHVMADVVLKNNAIMIKGKNIQLINAISPELPDAYADEKRIQQVFYNLLGNAIKFTESGSIKVGAKVDGESIIVSVKDTGIGIPKDKREAIFNAFEQGDGTISREYTGAGLGLSISKQLVELHGGKIWVEAGEIDSSKNTSENATGSIFYFSLPVSKGYSREMAIGEKIYPEEKILTPDLEILSNENDEFDGNEIHHILIVDDEPVNQQVLKNHLSSVHCKISQAMNGQEALKKLERDETISLVLLDIMMPKMSGYVVCEKIRQKYLPSELPVIMITAKNQVEDLVQAFSLGANDYITKPFNKDEFLARIKTQLDLRHIFDVTGRFVPNEFIRLLGKDRITDVVLGDHAELEVTVLFTDIRDYTSLAESMTPEETYRFVNAFNGRIGPIIQKYQGFVNQYLGDAVMAIFPKAAADAMQAAIEIHQEIQRYNEYRQSKDRKAISIGMGLHTGSLIMGIIGDSKRMDAATIADTVNIASRLESLTKYYQNNILLSKNTYDKILDKENYHFRFLGKVQVKGKNEPVDIFECFDGDMTLQKQNKIGSTKKFNEGLKYYLSKDFPRASVAFQEVLQINPFDKTAQLFRDKAARLIIQGIAADWDGVEKMEYK